MSRRPGPHPGRAAAVPGHRVAPACPACAYPLPREKRPSQGSRLAATCGPTVGSHGELGVQLWGAPAARARLPGLYRLPRPGPVGPSLQALGSESPSPGAACPAGESGSLLPAPLTQGLGLRGAASKASMTLRQPTLEVAPWSQGAPQWRWTGRPGPGAGGAGTRPADWVPSTLTPGRLPAFRGTSLGHWESRGAAGLLRVSRVRHRHHQEAGRACSVFWILLYKIETPSRTGVRRSPALCVLPWRAPQDHCPAPSEAGVGAAPSWNPSPGFVSLTFQVFLCEA